MPKDIINERQSQAETAKAATGANAAAHPASDPNPEAAATLAAWTAHSGTQSYQQLRRVLVGLDQIVCGLLLFLVAAAISLKKAGLWPQERLKSLFRLLKPRKL